MCAGLSPGNDIQSSIPANSCVVCASGQGVAGIKWVMSFHDRPTPPVRSVAIVAFDNAKLMDIAGPLQAFHDARHEDGSPAYAVRLVSEQGGMVQTDAGVRLETTRLEDGSVEGTDTLLVAGGDLFMPASSTESLRATLAPVLAAPRRIGSVCTGAFVLAQMGLLDGLPATTHWAAAKRFAQQHPAVDLQPDAIFVTAGRIWTSAGVTAGVDMALAMIAADIGHPAALAVARAMVVYVDARVGSPSSAWNSSDRCTTRAAASMHSTTGCARTSTPTSRCRRSPRRRG